MSIWSSTLINQAQAKDLKEAQQIIDALWLHMANLHELIERQIADLKEKLNTNSRNSSKPPSADYSKKPKKKIKQHGAGKNQGAKQGAQSGQRLTAANYCLLKRVTTGWFVCLPKATCDCGGKVQATPDSFRRHQQFELPEIKPIVTEYHPKGDFL
jgi:transposase